MFSKSNKQVNVKESIERKKSISSSMFHYETEKTDFENDKFDFYQHFIIKNIEQQLHMSNEFTDFRSKNQLETEFTQQRFSKCSNNRSESNI